MVFPLRIYPEYLSCLLYTSENSPLKQAEDAVLVDTSGLTIDEVIGEILRLAAEKGIG